MKISGYSGLIPTMMRAERIEKVFRSDVVLLNDHKSKTTKLRVSKYMNTLK